MTNGPHSIRHNPTRGKRETDEAGKCVRFKDERMNECDNATLRRDAPNDYEALLCGQTTEKGRGKTRQR